MKYVSCLIFLFVCYFHGNGQDTKVIRFVYAGEQLKPHGSLAISVDAPAAPYGRLADSLFGLSIQTDSATFFFILHHIKEDKLLKSTPTPVGISEYVVMTPGDKRYYLPEDNFKQFFEGLAAALSGVHLDSRVSKALPYWWANWRSPY
jgi:hypothetical protein